MTPFNVHLIRTHEVGDDFYDQVASLIRKFPGPMKIITDKNYETFLLNEDEILAVDTNENTFYTKEIVVNECYYDVDCSMESLKSFPLRPPKIDVASWDTLFKRCRKFRKENSIGSNDRIVLLTEIYNEHNWFSAADKNGDNNFFVHTGNWDLYTPAEDRFPVTYLIATGILQKIMFPNYKELNKAIHHESKGCISDFCEDKRDIIIKMRTADICPDCMNIIRNKKVEHAFLSQCYSIMEHIRKQLLFRERFEELQLPSRLLITRKKEPIKFLDMDNAELRLSPIQKAVYMLFLENPDGIHFNRLFEHRKRLEEIYDQVGHDFTLAKKVNTLEKVTNPIENCLSEIASKIRKKLIDYLGEELAKNYCIEGPNGEAKKIALSRDLVEWE